MYFCRGVSWDDTGSFPLLIHNFRYWAFTVGYKVSADSSVGNVNVTGVGSLGRDNLNSCFAWDASTHALASNPSVNQ